MNRPQGRQPPHLPTGATAAMLQNQRQQAAIIRATVPSASEVDWGDPFEPNKPTHVTRLTFTNLGGIPMKIDSVQNIEIHKFIDTNQVDIFLNAENNIAWHNLLVQNRLHARTQGWFHRLHLAIGCLQLPTGTAARQSGGTTVWTVNNLTA
jgi:hypothetical protein